MTTIAYDGKTLASDSQSTQGNIRVSNSAMKIFARGEGDDWSIEGKRIAAFGVAGNLHDAKDLRQRMSSFVGHHSGDHFENGSTFAFIAIAEDHTVFVGGKYSDEPRSWVMEAEAPVAVGSGGDFALGAMAAGAKAEDAVRIASKFDVNTNDSVSSIDCWGNT
ncbi:hypothetical protein pEaSNUABM10_00003 [Erwinia phage pEa_SNUABM_10]|nr:hypothetical protein pEaSNUABM10_00003 [Erwinia phage pEa_SNUABM_10]